MQKEIEKIFFVSEIIASENVALMFWSVYHVTCRTVL